MIAKRLAKTFFLQISPEKNFDAVRSGELGGRSKFQNQEPSISNHLVSVYKKTIILPFTDKFSHNRRITLHVVGVINCT